MVVGSGVENLVQVEVEVGTQAVGDVEQQWAHDDRGDHHDGREQGPPLLQIPCFLRAERNENHEAKHCE